MKGEEKLWAILNDKLDNLRATNRLPQAIRVAETALEGNRLYPYRHEILFRRLPDNCRTQDFQADRSIISSRRTANRIHVRCHNFDVNRI